ncbi:MAG: acyl-ACP--UDP-N-acetylglucosamine O-acyltransferase [Acidobacteriota bacterium]|jgi:UDP-N-acetylglucosamine acyltransferase
MPKIHPTAVVEPGARIAESCEIGPLTYVGSDVTIGEESILGPHTCLTGKVTVGERNTFVSHVAVGGPPQDLKYKGEPTEVIIGSDNVFREFVTVNRGTVGGGGVVRLGSNILMMAYSHVAHDCQVGDDVIFANAATLAGHVHVGAHSTVGAFSAVHQFCRVGDYAFIGGFSVITKDALPFIKTVGARSDAKIYGINTIGLERKGFSKESIEGLRSAYRLLFQSDLLLKEALDKVEAELGFVEAVGQLVSFIRESERGIQR